MNIGYLIASFAVLTTLGIFILTQVFNAIRKSAEINTKVADLKEGMGETDKVVDVMQQAVTSIDKNITKLVSQMEHFNDFRVAIETHNNSVSKKFDEHLAKITDLEKKLERHIGEFSRNSN